MVPALENGLRLTSTAEASSIEAQPAVSRDASPRSISYNGPEEVVVTDDEGRGRTIETAIVIDDDGDEGHDNDALEVLARHLSQGEPSPSQICTLTNRLRS